MSVRGFTIPHARPYMILHTYIIIVSSIFINPTKPYRITAKRFFMSGMSSFIKDARELKSSLEYLDLPIIDDPSFSEENLHRISKQLKFAYAECYSFINVPGADKRHIFGLIDLSLSDFFTFDSFIKMRMALLEFLDKFIDYIITLEEFDMILSDAFAGGKSNSFWYNADDEIYFHIFKDYDDSISMMKIQDRRIEKSSPQEFIAHYRSAHVYPISDTFFYYRYTLNGITFKEH